MFPLACQRALSRLRTTLLLAAPLLLGGACSVVNQDHCGNQDGNATCLQRDPSAPYCSICVADNNGCLAADPGTLCLAETAPATSVDPTTTTSPTTTTTAEPTTGTTTEPPTGTTTPDPSTGTTTAESTSTSTTTPDPTTGTTTPDPGTGDTTTTGPDTDTSTGTGDTTMSSSDSEGTTVVDLCGNDMIDGEEVCDGKDLGGKFCATLLPDKWGGGMLKCNNCSSFNDTECCIGVGQKCDPLKPSEACCGGLKCKAAELLVNRCQN